MRDERRAFGNEADRATAGAASSHENTNGCKPVDSASLRVKRSRSSLIPGCLSVTLADGVKVHVCVLYSDHIKDEFVLLLCWCFYVGGVGSHPSSLIHTLLLVSQQTLMKFNPADGVCDPGSNEPRPCDRTPSSADSAVFPGERSVS